FRSRACVVVLAGIAALVCAAGIASANTNADAKTRVWDFDSAAPLHTWLDADASPRLHLENQSGSGEPASASPHAARGLGALSQAGKYGIQPYNQLTKALKGTGLQAHHLVEQRFAGVLGQNARQMASVAVTKAEHQAFTNAWRQAIPYGQGTANATRQQVLD